MPDELQLFDSAQIPVDPSASESEEDVASALSATRASVSSADWTIETLVGQLKKSRIDLNPKFQRRAAWTDPTKSKFIESAILAYPIPQLVLAERRDQPGHFLVIDGKQRLLALRQFYAGQGDETDTDFTPLKLSTLTVLSDLKGYTISDLETKRSNLFDSFENHTIRTVVVRHWDTEEFLYTLFLRLNTGSVPLSAQELRQALVPGPFVDFVDAASGDSPGLRNLLGNTGPDRRMVDAELVVRHLGFQLSPVPYRGNLKLFLDGVCSVFNERWSGAEETVVAHLDTMEQAITAARTIFGEDYACHKWNGVKWERSFNKAVFDIQIGALANQNLRLWAQDHAADVQTAFMRLCEEDTSFSQALSTTTKSLAATRERFGTWFAALKELSGVDLQRPSCLDDPVS
jgi:hypothetical protein